MFSDAFSFPVKNIKCKNILCKEYICLIFSSMVSSHRLPHPCDAVSSEVLTSTAHSLFDMRTPSGSNIFVISGFEIHPCGDSCGETRVGTENLLSGRGLKFEIKIFGWLPSLVQLVTRFDSRDLEK